MIKFGSIKNIEKASFEKLLETPSINKLAAESIIEFFENKNKEKSDGNQLNTKGNNFYFQIINCFRYFIAYNFIIKMF